jgi:hypothetical protein
MAQEEKERDALTNTGVKPDVPDTHSTCHCYADDDNDQDIEYCEGSDMRFNVAEGVADSRCQWGPGENPVCMAQEEKERDALTNTGVKPDVPDTHSTCHCYADDDNDQDIEYCEGSDMRFNVAEGVADSRCQWGPGENPVCMAQEGDAHTNTGASTGTTTDSSTGTTKPSTGTTTDRDTTGKDSSNTAGTTDDST